MPESTLYCTQFDLERLLSREGVENALTDYLGAGTDEVLSMQFCEDASLEVESAIGFRYLPSELAKSPLVTRLAAVLALYVITTRKGDPAPPGIAAAKKWADKLLDDVREYRREIPRIAEIEDAGEPVRQTPVVHSVPLTNGVPDEDNRVLGFEVPTQTGDDEYGR